MNDIAEEVLEFTFSGDPADPIKKHLTGLWSFDHAFINSDDEIGMPLGCAYEVYGVSGVGKSTACYSLAGILGKQLETNIHLSDLEGFNPKHLGNILRFIGFTGDIHLGHQGTDNKILEDFEDIIHKRGKYENHDLNHTIGILDSIAAISPTAEREGDLEGANMGRRAFLMNQFSRRLLPTVHPRTVGSENVYFLINHWLPRIGENGYVSPGGLGKNYLCAVQIHLKRKYISWKGKQVANLPDGSYLLEGTLHKNRHGFNRTTFQVFIKAGVGIHPGLTAVFDCLNLKLAKRGKTIKIGDESHGYLTTMIRDDWDNDEAFQPFYDALEEHENETKKESVSES